MEKFRLPRKIKKKLRGHIWLYPPDDKGNRLMAWPYKSAEDYAALKEGLVSDIIDSKNSKTRRKEYREKIDKVIMVTNEELKTFVDEIFAEKYRHSSYNILIAAKQNPKAIIAYYNFINAWYLYQNGEDSFSNICCMAVDLAKKLLKESSNRR
jgi:hypothetical protein